MRPVRLNALEIEKTRSTTPLTGEIFNIVDGEEYPELLVTNDRTPEEVDLENRRLTIPDAERDEIKKRVESGLGFGFSPKGFRLDRTLRRNTHDKHTYERILGLKRDGFAGVVRDIQAEFGEAVRIADLGCGYGHAFAEMLDIKGVDRKKSVGITIHSPEKAVKEARNRVAYGNILFLSPNEIRFHVATSVVGATAYHPLNRHSGCNRKMFGVLHGLKMLEEGGILLSEEFDPVISSQLIELGIAETPQPLAHNFAKKFEPSLFSVAVDTKETLIDKQALRLLRRPTIEEVKQLLGTDEQGTYWM